MDDSDTRHGLFEAARLRAEWNARQLWLAYLSLGGIHGAFEIEAYLAGLTPLGPGQQDVLAAALNERLDDLYRAASVPYLVDLHSDTCSTADSSTVLDDLLRRFRPRP